MLLATTPVEQRSFAAERLQDRDLGPATLVVILGLLTLLRLVALALSPSELGFDEAQYWAWSQDFAFGYFTKPPLIAWLIGAETAVCGNGAACVRAASPLLHFGTALVLAALARRLYGPVTGFWTGIFYAILPGVALSSFLMTTDAPLLFCWSVALLALVSHLERPTAAKAIVFGIATGIGLLAKYAMVYLPVMALLVALVDADARRVLRRPLSLLAIAIFLAILAPNLVWNATNGFATFRHVGGDNIGWSLPRINATGGFEFLGAQFGVAGPVVFGAMLNALIFGLRSERPRTDRLLLWLSIPLILALTFQGFLSRANANWAATAYPAGVVLATALILRDRRPYYFYANLIVCGVLSLAILAVTAFLDPISATGPARQFRQLGGWAVTADNLEHVADATGASRLVIEGRALTAGLVHPLRESGLTIEAFMNPGDRPGDQFELDAPWHVGDPAHDRLFFGLSDEDAKELGLTPAAEVDAPLYSAKTGRMTVWHAK
ncbi:ArnT family glycosyltransferase [Consotaella aegiceratis]|uniref:ArnT family glycosyltransferase n=1 Tax=Consotaella aegiceratis TaxID=3097961 RepID=UPI002F3ED45C